MTKKSKSIRKSNKKSNKKSIRKSNKKSIRKSNKKSIRKSNKKSIGNKHGGGLFDFFKSKSSMPTEQELKKERLDYILKRLDEIEKITLYQLPETEAEKLRDEESALYEEKLKLTGESRVVYDNSLLKAE